MPASLTRPCPSCARDLPTPSAFRDLDDQAGPGRPPRVCRECREADPELAAKQAHNVTRRASGMAYRLRLSARDAADLSAAAEDNHPAGVKVCPAVAGCGETLPLHSFQQNSTSRDGLEAICRGCRADHAAVREARA